LILASTSRWRIELLARLDLPFVSVAPDFDERAEDHRLPELGPHAFALELARGKARSVAATATGANAWVLAADQLAVLDEPEGPQLLHKPGTEERAVEQLMQLRGRTHRLISGVVLARGGIEHYEIDEHHLTMRMFERAEAEAYVARHRPIHSAGSYHIEDAGIRLFERIDSRGGDHTGIMGLPLLAVCRLLRAAGFLMPPQRV
jgi:septum formation protein